MKANELRIGNWVMGDLKKPYQFELSDFSDWYNEHNSHEFGNYIYPIPLTEEWLLKFGFEYDTITYYKNELMLSINKGYYNVWYHTLTHGRLFIEMKYVHQLQNLYFALTGEELTIHEIKD